MLDYEVLTDAFQAISQFHPVPSLKTIREQKGAMISRIASCVFLGIAPLPLTSPFPAISSAFLPHGMLFNLLAGYSSILLNSCSSDAELTGQGNI